MPSTRPATLPSSVYWRRRLILITIAALLFVVISKLLGSGGGGAGAGEVKAIDAAGATTPTAGATPGQQPTHTSTHQSSVRPTPPPPTPTPTPTTVPLAQPSGDCEDADVSVVPQVPVALAGQSVSLVLVLRTLHSPACFWQLSSSHLALKISRGASEVWSTRECPKAVTAQNVVVRRDVPTQVVVTWSSRLSDEGCTDRTQYASPGSYELLSAALGGEPAHVRFELTVPPSPTPTPTPHPSSSPSAHPTSSGSAHPAASGPAHPTTSGSAHPTGHPSGSATAHPTHHPSGTASPGGHD